MDVSGNGENLVRAAAIILAAGFSSRMKEFKPLLPLGNQTMADHLISVFLQCSVDVILVAGYRQNELLAGIKSRNILVASNPHYEMGMLSSIQAGVMKVGPGCTHFFVNPVDVPLIKPSTIRRLLGAARTSPDKILFPVFQDKRGHPPLLPASLIAVILNYGGEGGLGAILYSQRHKHLEVQVEDSGILFDVDTPEDYRELLKRFGKAG